MSDASDYNSPQNLIEHITKYTKIDILQIMLVLLKMDIMNIEEDFDKVSCKEKSKLHMTKSIQRIC